MSFDTDNNYETRFNWVFLGEKNGPDPDFDRDLSGDKDVAIIPTRGSLVPGWFLLVPRVKKLSVSQLSEAERSGLIKNAVEVASLAQNLDEHIFLFEHGPCSQKSAVGCGVDQAHLHVVPLGFNLLSLCFQADDGMEWQEVSNGDPWRNIAHNKDYYLISNMEKTYIAYSKQQYSQYFRRKIAEGLGVKEQWDYKLYPYKENALRTIEYFVSKTEQKKAA